VATGAEKVLKAKLLDACDTCEGSGAEPGSKPVTCTTCSGSGEVRRAQRSFFGQFVSVAPCPTCAGEGVTIATPCKKCRGEGRVRAEKTIKLQVPAGVATGQYMTLRGQGNVGPRGGPRGDVIALFDVEEDPRFERDGEDLFTEVLVSYPQLVLGDDIAVPGVQNDLSLRVPAGTQSGKVFHLPDAGSARERERRWRPARARTAVDARQAVGARGAARARTLAGAGEARRRRGTTRGCGTR
jgi:molecular chaperone DnaJ